jgi:hypothetical protein
MERSRLDLEKGSHGQEWIWRWDGGVHHCLLRQDLRRRPKVAEIKTSPNATILISNESWGDVHHPCANQFYYRLPWREESELEFCGVQLKLDVI